MKKLVLIQAVSALDQQAVAITSEPAPPSQPTSDDDQDLFGFVKHNARTENVTRVHSSDQEIKTHTRAVWIPAAHLYCCSIHILVPAFLKYIFAALPSDAASS